jgi:hypothetical protein|tara:strand:+ start:303 stop:479 length:177 start_codon:yes stop_codon:yes gene_type:complete
MIKSEKNCTNCQTKYSVTWDDEKTDMTPFTCPFCGYEVDDDEENESVIPDEADHDSWN